MLMAVACSLAAFLALLAGAAPYGLQVFAGVGTVEVLTFFLVTLKWKISGHATAAAATAVFFTGLYGWVASPALIIIPLVAWARVRLRRHTLMQTIAGSVAGAVFMILMFTLIRYGCTGDSLLCG